MRTHIQVSLKCADCGNELQCDAERSRFIYNSANDAAVAMFITPCTGCKRKYQEPVKLLSAALRAVADATESKGISDANAD